jgi:hypothetical protein
MLFRKAIVSALGASLFLTPWLTAQTQPATKPAAKPVPKPQVEVTNEQVDAAIQKAVEYIYSQHKGEHWDEPQPDPKKHASQWGGLTAIAVYGLLAAGEKPSNNPKLAQAIEWLKKNDKITGTYAVGIRAQIWQMLPPDEATRAAAKRDLETLIQGQRSYNAATKQPVGFRGMWHYTPTSYRSYDHSTAQYGTLGLWALEKFGLEVPDAVWKASDDQWRKDQQPDGGWIYRMAQDPAKPSASNVSMTAAGIATLFITQDYLQANAGIACRGNYVNPTIQKGLDWMETNLPKGIGGASAYAMYGIERIGVASGYKYFGTLDWYQAGAAALVRRQSKEGWWPEHGYNVAGAAYGIVFLVRGRAPVVMNKLQYSTDGKEAAWNQRPRDAANAVKYMMKQMERDLNWQIVNLDVPVDDLHDSPILYISGSAALKFTEEEEKKLQQFVEQGGMIFGHADCNQEAFTKSFKALGTKLFKGYEFRKIEDGHPIYTRQQFVAKTWKTKPDLQGMSNGIRELMLLIPSGDPARAWQLGDFKPREESFQLMGNIFLYAVEGRDLRFKGSTYLVKADPKIKPKNMIKLARIEVGDNWDPEPGGWRRFANVMHNTVDTKLEVTTVKPDADALKPFKVAHLTGTTKVNLTGTQRDAIKAWIESGGTLLIDAAGGSGEFVEGMESQLNTMFGRDAEKLSSSIPADHPLYSATGSPMGEVMFRPFARGKLPNGQRTPLVRGITVKDRLAVLFSREDLSTGLVGMSIDGVTGYTAASSTEVMKNLVLFGSRGGAPAPSTQPAKPATKPATSPAK